MSNYITSLKIKGLSDDDIDIALGDSMKHLVLTGKNSHGKCNLIHCLNNRLNVEDEKITVSGNQCPLNIDISYSNSAPFNKITLTILPDKGVYSLNGLKDNRSFLDKIYFADIIFIDIPEAGMHISDQRKIIPFLIKTLPPAQFIISTHSPFVLNSVKDAVAFDLDTKKRLEDPSDYCISSLMEGYFDVATESSPLRTSLDKYIELVKQDSLDEYDKFIIKKFEKQFEALNGLIAPTHVKGQFHVYKALRLKNHYF